MFVCWKACTVYPKKYAHGFVVLCFVVVMQSFIMNSHEVFIHIHQGCFAGTGAIVRLPQCQWSKPDGYVKISQCITTTKHSKAKTVCIFLGIYCIAATWNNGIILNHCIRVTSWWARWLFKPPASRWFTKPFLQAQIKENIIAPRHWPLWGEFSGDRWIPRTKGPVMRKMFSFDDVIMGLILDNRHIQHRIMAIFRGKAC